MTLSLAAVFIPVLFMGGIMGRLFHEFAVTISVAILISGFVSLSLTPMLCSRFLQAAGRTPERVPARLAKRCSTACATLYDWTLRGVLRHRFADHAGRRPGTLVATVYLYGLVPKGFIPNQDTGQIQRLHRSAAGHLLRRHGASASRRWPTIVAADPDIDAFTSSVGRRRRRRRRQCRAASSSA